MLFTFTAVTPLIASSAPGDEKMADGTLLELQAALVLFTFVILPKLKVARYKLSGLLVLFVKPIRIFSL